MFLFIFYISVIFVSQKVNEYDQEMLQLNAADQPRVP